jgi:hypothetical protein
MVPSSSRFIGSLPPPGKNNNHPALFSFSGFYHSIQEFTILIVGLFPKSTRFVAWPVKKNLESYQEIVFGRTVSEIPPNPPFIKGGEGGFLAGP